MYGLWLLFIIFAVIAVVCFLAPVMVYCLYKHYREQTKFVHKDYCKNYK